MSIHPLFFWGIFGPDQSQKSTPDLLQFFIKKNNAWKWPGMVPMAYIFE